MLSRRAFTNRLHRMGPQARRDFLAALWSARGWEVVDDGEPAEPGAIVVERTHPRPERAILVFEGDEAGPGGATRTAGEDLAVVVADGDPADPEHVVRRLDPGDLYEMLRYGVDHPARAAIIRRHLGYDRDSWSRRPGPASSPAPARDRRRSARRSSAAVLAVVVLLLAGILSATAVGAADSTAAPLAARHADGELRYVMTCISSPVGVAPTALLPRFADGGPFDPDDWTETADPLADPDERFRGSPVSTPERRAVVAYTGPDEHRYRVEVARWRTRWMADDAADRATTSTVRVTWEWWSFDVRVVTASGRQVRTPVAAATAEALIGTIDLDGVADLDADCPAQIGGL